MLQTKVVTCARITFDPILKLVHVYLNEEVEIGIEESSEVIEAVLILVNKTSFYLIIDGPDTFININHEARLNFSEHKEYNSLNIAKALIVSSMPTKIIIDFYSKSYKHKKPLKIFSDMNVAKKWLFNH